MPSLFRLNAARIFTITATLEALTWLGLLIGMWFKYSSIGNEIGVKIFGPIHGAVFVAYLLATVAVAIDRKWPIFWTTSLAFMSAIPPFATVIFERWATKVGRLPSAR